MPRQLTTTDIVWLATLRGASLEETWQEAQQEAKKPVSRNYVASLRSHANELIRTRYHSMSRNPRTSA
jgi:hypothetical protein